MEKLFNPYDKESMRMAMLKHEETFREQVYELHRLYQVQKILMKNIVNGRKHGLDSDIRTFKIAPEVAQTDDHKDFRAGRPGTFLDLGLPVEMHRPPAMTGGNGAVKMDDDETELELTLGLGPSSSKSTRRTNTDSAASLSNSSSTESSHMKMPESGNFLTPKNSSKQELIGWQWGLDHHHHHLQSSSSHPAGHIVGSRKNGSSIEDMAFRQDRHSISNPPWLFQALSLNTT